MLDGHRAERGTYPSFQIMYLKSDQRIVRTNVMQGVAHGGQFVLLNCSNTIAISLWGGVDSDALDALRWSGSPVLLLADNCQARANLCLGAERKALHPIKIIYKKFRSGTYLSETILVKYVTDILAWFVDVPVGQNDVDRSGHDIQNVMTYIANHLDESLELHQFAAMTGLGGAALLEYSKKQPVIASCLCHGRANQYSSKHAQQFLQACRPYNPQLRIFQAIRFVAPQVQGGHVSCGVPSSCR